MLTLKQYLEDQGIKFSAFARKINYSKTYLNLVINGHNIPSRKLAIIIEDATKGAVSRYSYEPQIELKPDAKVSEYNCTKLN